MLHGEKFVELLLMSTLKVTLVLAFAAGWLLIAKRASASMRHWICSAALLSTLIIPVLALAMPVWFVPILPESTSAKYVTFKPAEPALLRSEGKDASLPANVAQGAGPKSIAPIKPPVAPAAPDLHLPAPEMMAGSNVLSWPRIILFTWLIGLMIVFALWLIQTYQVWRVTRLGLRIDDPAWVALREEIAHGLKIERRVALILSERVTVPLTWGLWRPAILLPRQAAMWSPERRRIVLLHEMVHIARWDYLTQCVALVSCALNWFNPLVWKMARYLSVEREQACDDQVLAMGTKGSDYAANLLAISRAAQRQWLAMPGILAMGEGSDLAKRVRRVLATQRKYRPFSRARSLSLSLLLAVALMPLSTMQPSRASAQSNPIMLTLALQPWIKAKLDETAVKGFEDAHPGVIVNYVDALPAPDPVDDLDAYFTAMQKYAASADVLLTTSFADSLAATPQSTRAGYLLDLAPLASSDPTLNIEDFYPQVWKSFQWDKGLWALPTSTDFMLLTYDPAALDRVGLPYPNDKWTLDDFANAVTKLSIKDPGGHVTAPGFANSGRVFRLALWQSLLNVQLYDESSVPNRPLFDQPGVDLVLDTYRQLEEKGYIGGDPANAPMIVSNAVSRDFLRPGRSVALLPSGKAGLLTSGFAVSAGTQHPDLAYQLARFLTTRAEFNIMAVPARKSVAAQMPSKGTYPPEVQALVEQALANAMPFSDMRFTSYLNAAWATSNTQTAKDAVLAVEVRANTDLKAASDKKATLTITITEPVIAVIPPGKIALKFDVSSPYLPLPNKELWDKLVQEFAASDPQVGLVNLKVTREPLSVAAASSDCFYLPSNAVQSMADNLVLPLDPFLNADASFDKQDLPPSILASVQRQGQTYALPIALEPLILRYDTDRFRAAGLPMPTNDWTIETFAETLKSLKPDAQSPVPFVDNGSSGIYLMVLIADYGGLPLDYRTNPPTINFTAPATVGAIRQALDLAKNGYIKYGAVGNLVGSYNVHPDNTTAIYPNTLNGFSAVKKFNGIDPNLPVLFPGGNQYTGIAYDLGGAYISALSQNPEACYRLISLISQHPELFTSMPARHSQLENAALKATTNPEVMALYKQVDLIMQKPGTVAFPSSDDSGLSVTAALYQHWLYEVFDSYVLNRGDLDAGLKTAESYAKAFQDCTANLPSLSIAAAGKNNFTVTRAYADCAEKIDPRLILILEPLINQ